MRRHTLPMPVLGIMAVVASACSSVTPTTTASANGGGPSHVYVALGENGMGGSAFQTNARAAWTQMFYQSALGTSGTFYDFSIPDQTVAGVLGEELRQAQAVHPDSANDVDEGVSVDVGDRATAPLFDDDSGHGGKALQSGCEVFVLTRSDCPALRARDFG